MDGGEIAEAGDIYSLYGDATGGFGGSGVDGIYGRLIILHIHRNVDIAILTIDSFAYRGLSGVKLQPNLRHFRVGGTDHLQSSKVFRRFPLAQAPGRYHQALPGKIVKAGGEG